MTPDARDWLAGLRRFSEQHRAPRPERRVPVPSETVVVASTAEALAAQAGILDRWLEDHGAGIRALFAERPGAAIVLTTTPPGFVAAERFRAGLAAADAERFAAVTEIEYRGWCMRSPDEHHRLHDNVWSWIKAPLPAARAGEFAAWPIPDGHAYWLHRRGRGGARTWRSADLWQWDGRTATLLASDVSERALRPGP